MAIDNSHDAIMGWAANSVKDANISFPEKKFLLAVAYKMIQEGCLRGDISEKWVKFGYFGYLKDLYL